MKKIISLFRLMRPKQWIKNVFVFAALAFAGDLFNLPMLGVTAIGFGLFCLTSSCVYIINDAIDKEKDRAHPKKCMRPIANGAVSVPQAIVLLVVLLLLVVFACIILSNLHFGLVLAAYLALNLAYSLRLKNEPILDIMCIALGFVFRALSGSFLVDVGISPWLIMCTFFLALFLAIHKRKSELQRFADSVDSEHRRKVLRFYNSKMLDSMSSVIDSATIIAYSMYAMSADSPLLMLGTIPFVIYGLFRYQLIIHTKDLAEAPDQALIQDRPLLICVFLWGLSIVGIIYLG